VRRSFVAAILAMLVVPACTTGSLERVSPSPSPAVATASPSPTPSPQADERGSPSPTAPSPTTASTASPVPDLLPPAEVPDASMGAALILLLDRLVDAEARAARAEAVTQALREQIARLQAQLDVLRDEIWRLEGGGP